MPSIEPLSKAYARAIMADIHERYGEYPDDIDWKDWQYIIQEAYEAGYRYRRAEKVVKNA